MSFLYGTSSHGFSLYLVKTDKQKTNKHNSPREPSAHYSLFLHLQSSLHQMPTATGPLHMLLPLSESPIPISPLYYA